MQLFHVASKDSLQAVLRDGLRYGSQGAFSSDSDVAKTNDLLDKLCPSGLRARGVSRNRCLYMYLTANGLVHDIADGSVRPREEWAASQKRPVLAIEVNPAVVYISDLDAYDAVVTAVKAGRNDEALQELGNAYWRSVICAEEALPHYAAKNDGLTRRSNAPAGLPERYNRIEIMVAADIKPSAIKVLSD